MQNNKRNRKEAVERRDTAHTNTSEYNVTLQ